MADNQWTPAQIQNAIAQGVAHDQASAIAWLNQNAGGGGGAPDPGLYPVYWGGLPGAPQTIGQTVIKDPDLGGRRIIPAARQPDKTINDGVAWLEDQWFNHTPVWDKIYQAAVNSGRVGTHPSPSQIEDLWKEALGWSASLYSRGQHLSPLDYLERIAPAGGTAAQAKTYTDRSVNLISAASAKGGTNQQYQQSLGRDASTGEQARALGGLRGAESANPNITTTHVDATGLHRSSVSTGGLSEAGANQLLEDQARQAPDYRGYQAAAFYGPLLMNELARATTSAGA